MLLDHGWKRVSATERGELWELEDVQIFLPPNVESISMRHADMILRKIKKVRRRDESIRECREG